jgi:HPt (histidine-containing phosphotransfer) domain-containing protein
MTDDPVGGVDPQALERLRETLREHGQAVVAQLIGGFFEESVKRLAAIDDALARADPEALRLSAHTLRGSAELLGARRLAQISRQMELAAGRQALDDARRLVGELQAEYARVTTELRAERGGPA